MKHVINTLLDLLFPQQCFGCRRSGSLLCEKCVREFPHASNNNIEKGHIHALFDYSDPIVKKTMWSLKYKGRKTLLRPLAQALYDELLEELHEVILFENFKNPILVPIPLSQKRLRKRGFNQAELIARELTHLDNNKIFTLCTDILYKVKDTPSQTSLKNRGDRMRNIKNCFAVKNLSAVRGKNIIIIDDIYTTGATIREAQKVLKAAGARDVIGIVVAH